MTKRDQARYDMCMQTADVLDEGIEYISTKPLIMEMKAEFDESLVDIGEQQQKSDVVTRGTTERKDKLKELLALKGSALAGGVYSLATKKKNDDLKAKSKVTKSDINNTPDKEVMVLVNRIIGLAETHVKDLAGLGITKAFIRDVQANLDEYQGLIGKSRSAIKRGQASKKTMTELISDTVELLDEQMDNAMTMFSLTHPEFYDRYKRARVIVDR